MSKCKISISLKKVYHLSDFKIMLVAKEGFIMKQEKYCLILSNVATEVFGNYQLMPLKSCQIIVIKNI